MEVIDDFIPKSFQDELEQVLTRHDFPWYYQPNINSAENIFRPEDNNFGMKLKPEMLKKFEFPQRKRRVELQDLIDLSSMIWKLERK